MAYPCVRCAGPGACLMICDYEGAEIRFEDILGPPDPFRGWSLCLYCGDRITPPRGWALSDLRTTHRLFAPY